MSCKHANEEKICLVYISVSQKVCILGSKSKDKNM